MTFPLAFLQSTGMVFFINYLLGGNVIETDPVTILFTAFALSVGSVMLLRLGELITEKGISNGISLLIFSSIVAGITGHVYTYVGGSLSFFDTTIFMLVIVLVLVVLSVLLIKTRKDIPVVYARQ